MVAKVAVITDEQRSQIKIRPPHSIHFWGLLVVKKHWGEKNSKLSVRGYSTERKEFHRKKVTNFLLRWDYTEQACGELKPVKYFRCPRVVKSYIKVFWFHLTSYYWSSIGVKGELCSSGENILSEKKLIVKDNTSSYCLTYYLADRTTFLALNSVLGSYFRLRTAFLIHLWVS